MEPRPIIEPRMEEEEEELAVGALSLADLARLRPQEPAATFRIVEGGRRAFMKPEAV